MSRYLRILEVNKAYYPHTGGIETLVKQYSEELGRMDGVEVKTLVCRDGRGRPGRLYLLALRYGGSAQSSPGYRPQRAFAAHG